MLLRKAAIAAALSALFAVFIWAASEPWKNPDFEKWSAKDVDKILNGSPWAKTITIPYYPYLNGDSQESDTHIKIGSASNPHGVADSQIYAPTGTFVLRWNSALTMRRALYREAILHGEDSDFASHRYLINDEDNIELTMIATGQTLLPPTEAINLVEETYLEQLPSGVKIEVMNAEPRSQVDARGDEGYIFYFPQKLKNGAQTLSKDATEIEFHTQVGVRRFDAKFKPADMVGTQGVEFY